MTCAKNDLRKKKPRCSAAPGFFDLMRTAHDERIIRSGYRDRRDGDRAHDTGGGGVEHKAERARDVWAENSGGDCERDHGDEPDRGDVRDRCDVRSPGLWSTRVLPS